MFFEGGAKTGIVAGGCGIPGEYFDTAEKFFDYDSQVCGLRQTGDAKAQFSFRDYGNSDLADRDLFATKSVPGESGYSKVFSSISAKRRNIS